MEEGSATIIAAIIGIVGTIIVTHFKDIVDLIRKPSRRIKGTWDGKSYWIIYKPEEPFDPEQIQKDNRLLDEYTVHIKQRGKRVKATMIESKVSEGHPKSEFKWKGKVIGDYLTYECSCDNPEKFLISNAMLFIHAGGKKMSGYFVANGGATTPSRTWVGFAEIVKRG